MQLLPSLALLAMPLALAQAPDAYPLESIKITGNERIPAERIIAASGLKVGSRVSRTDFNAARDRLMETGAFNGVGFRYAPSAANSGYDATFEVRETTPLYRYRFEELPATETELRDILRRQETLFDEAIPAVPRVMNRYSVALANFLKAKDPAIQVIGEINSDLPGEPMILFRQLGERRVVSEVNFEGYKAFEIQDLWRFVNQSAIGTRFSEVLFRRVLDGTVRPPYEDRGYLRVAFPKITTERSTKNEGLNVTVTIDEGSVYRLGIVTLVGTDGRQDERLHKLGAWSKDDVANITAIEEGIARIRKDFRQNGYLRVKSETGRVLHDAERIADIRVVLDPGPRFTMGKLSIKGLDIIGEPAIRKLWGMEEGAIYRESYPDDFVAKVQADGYFDNLQRIGVESVPNDDTHTVDVTLTFIGGRVTTDAERQRRGR
jgi:outer membrane protein assembly factor BamA